MASMWQIHSSLRLNAFAFVCTFDANFYAFPLINNNQDSTSVEMPQTPCAFSIHFYLLIWTIERLLLHIAFVHHGLDVDTLCLISPSVESDIQHFYENIKWRSKVKFSSFMQRRHRREQPTSIKKNHWRALDTDNWLLEMRQWSCISTTEPSMSDNRETNSI